jgi:hypothetical protein
MDPPRIEMTIFHLEGTKVVSYNAAGKIMLGDPADVEEGFLYIVERPDGSTETLKPSEFLKRTGQQK